MIYVVVFAAVAIIPGRLGGYAAVFAAAGLDGLKPVHVLHFGQAAHGVYTGLLALAVNGGVVLTLNTLLPTQVVADRTATTS